MEDCTWKIVNFAYSLVTGPKLLKEQFFSSLCALGNVVQIGRSSPMSSIDHLQSVKLVSSSSSIMQHDHLYDCSIDLRTRCSKESRVVEQLPIVAVHLHK